MSTVLEALRERERGHPAGPRDQREARRWRGWLPAVAAASTLGGAAVGLLVMRSSSSPSHGQRVAASADLPPPPAAVQPAAQAAPPAALPAVDEPPRARVKRWQPASGTPPTALTAAKSPSGLEGAGAPPAQTAASGEGTSLRLESIAYAKAAGERSVTLAIDGAPVVLRQGESASGIEVQLILPEAVYLRYGTDVFAVGAVR